MKLLRQKPDDLKSFKDMLSKNTCTAANFLRSWPGCESLTNCCIKYDNRALIHGTNVLNYVFKECALKWGSWPSVGVGEGLKKVNHYYNNSSYKFVLVM